MILTSWPIPANATTDKLDQWLAAGMNRLWVGNTNTSLQAASHCAWAYLNDIDAIVTDNPVGDLYDGTYGAPGSTQFEAVLNTAVANYGVINGVAGYWVCDEPTYDQLPSAAAAVAGLESRDPTKFGYVNLLPSYASVARIGPDYEAYIRRYVSLSGCKMFSIDSFLPMIGTKYEAADIASLVSDYRIVQDVARDYSAYWWATVCTQPFVSGYEVEDLTIADIRFQSNIPIAYGATGLVLWTYKQPDDDGTYTFGVPLVDKTYVEDAKYGYWQTVSAELLQRDAYLSSLTWQSASYDATTGIVVGSWSDSYHLVVNATNAAQTVNLVTLLGETPRALIDGSFTETTSMAIGAGDAVLVKIVKPTVAGGNASGAFGAIWTPKQSKRFDRWVKSHPIGR